MPVRALLCGFLGAFLIVASAPAQDVRDTVGPIEKQSKPITPENPIPRRSFSVTALYPAEAASLGVSGAVALVATIDGSGRVVEIRKVRQPLAVAASTPPNPAALQIAADAMLRDAASALRRWTYDPPANGPMSFQVSFTFRPDGEVTATQNASVPAPAGIASSTLGGLVAPANPNQPIRVGGNIKAPTLIAKVEPTYPPIAQSARVSGVVILETTIATDGSVADVKVLRSIPLLDQAAIEAVRHWRYTPTLLNGVPVPVIMTVTVTFTLPAPPVTAQ